MNIDQALLPEEQTLKLVWSTGVRQCRDIFWLHAVNRRIREQDRQSSFLQQQFRRNSAREIRPPPVGVSMYVLTVSS